MLRDRFLRILLPILSLTVGARAQPVLYVRAEAPPAGDGASWTTAFNDLQDALDRARTTAGTNEIWVAQGVYKPDRATGARTTTFDLVNGVALRGGFAGTEASINERDIPAHPTTLSGDIGVPNNPADNSLHVVTFTSTGTSSTLDGFIISGGQADVMGGTNDLGAGLLFRAINSTLLVSNCLFRDSTARQGAGIYSRFGTLELNDCDFDHNIATSDGGAVWAQNFLTMRRCNIANSNAAFGAGLWFCCGNGRVEDCSFRAGFATNGGGVFASSGVLHIVRSTITGNSASLGGGVYSASMLTMVSSLLAGNFAGSGAGAYLQGAGTIVNGVVSRNFATNSGGGVFNEGNAVLKQCTFVSNMAIISGGGLHTATLSAIVDNSILWDNTDSVGSGEVAQVRRVSGALTMNSCCVKNWSGTIAGAGSFGADPRLTGAAGPDGQLGTPDDAPQLGGDSPCIDRGNNLLVPNDTADADSDGDVTEFLPIDRAGDTRFRDDTQTPDQGAGLPPVVDVGAYEFMRLYPGDINRDGRVDLADMALVIQHWDTPGPIGDVDGDGWVGLSDVAVLIQHWGFGITPVPPDPSPGP
ncbi:MAG TPA: dockerin type I domain-containing protein [Phycisphaerales bacterium]|nr:dockerin type I domain-containing protein [Phycisphaerales bacterium]